MTLAQYYDRQVPDYYASMFLDGYTPEQIRYAARRKMIQQFEARTAAKRAEAEATTTPEVKIVSEVRIK